MSHQPRVVLAIALAIFVCGCGSTTSKKLPRVVVDYPMSTFVETCETYTNAAGSAIHQCQGPSKLVVRPSAISLSVDGDGYLSDLNWSSWTAASAIATGLMTVRCFGGSTDAQCYAGRFSYDVPVTVRLSGVVATKRGEVYTVLATTRSPDQRSVFCLPPAEAC